MSKRWLTQFVLLIIAFPTWAQTQSSTQSTSQPNPTSQPDQPSTQSQENGIFVGEPKVYDDRSLQLLLGNLKSRLGQLSGLDQASLISRIGALQGASATTWGFSMQANGTPQPGVTTTASQAGPTSTQTTGGTTTTTPSSTGTTTTVTAPTGTTTTTTTTSSTTATSTANNQTVVATPGSTLQTQTTSPAVTPTPPALPNVPSFSLPSGFSPSSLDVLGEQMQLSYEIINLQLLLEGSLNDQYVKGTRLMKQHSTVGFPISIAVPPGKEYRNAVAEIEVTVCDPPVVDDISEGPSLMTILPREKTYNVASIVNKSVSLGASGVVAGIVSVGANFLWGHQTYYVVQDQDTVAIQRTPREGACPDFQRYTSPGVKVSAGKSTPAIFAWQFRPVLGQKTVKQGLRQTFAQVSFPPGPQLACAGSVIISTKWRKYDSKNGIVGDDLPNSLQKQSWSIASFYPNPFVQGVETLDNADGSLTITVSGHYLPGTRIRVGSVFLDETVPGFQNTSSYIRFVAPGQVIALNGAYVISRDGVESEIAAPGQGAPGTLPACEPAKPPVAREINPTASQSSASYKLDRGAPRLLNAGFPSASNEQPGITTDAANSSAPVTGVTLAPFSDASVIVTVPLSQSMTKEIAGGPYPIVVVLGTKIFGLSDSPFRTVTGTDISFIAPRDLVRSQRALTIKRLFLGKDYANRYAIPQLSDFAVSGITVLSSSKVETAFVVAGSGLDSVTFLQPPGVAFSALGNGTVGLFKLSALQLDGLKQIILQHATDPPVIVALPDSKPPETKPHLAAHDPISPGTGVIYTITGSLLESIAAIRYLDKPLPFALSLDKKSVSLRLPDEMTTSAGIRSLVVVYTDSSSERFTVTVK